MSEDIRGAVLSIIFVIAKTVSTSFCGMIFDILPLEAADIVWWSIPKVEAINWRKKSKPFK